MKEIIRAFKALSDPTRLRIFLLLMERELCVCELMFVLDMPQSRVSHQLRLLRDADLVEDKRDGRWIIYAIPPTVKESLAPLLRQFAGPELAESASVLEDMKRLDLCIRENVRKKPEAAMHQSSV
jgi:ArsR family transcriptional regulator, arsenate/arsenite/antimonite-responsive transcriptional repressor